MKILLVDDEPEAIEGLRRILGGAAQVKRVIIATNRADAVALAMEGVDVILMDVKLGAEDGIDVAAAIHALLPNVPILMVTNYEDRSTLRRALRAGARGFLLKTARPQEIRRAVIGIEDGYFFSPSVAAILVEELSTGGKKDPLTGAEKARVPRLTDRERQVLELMETCRSYQEVAERIGVSLSTVKRHMENSMRKLGAKTKTQAVMRKRRLD